jgi:hypothetical protein
VLRLAAAMTAVGAVAGVQLLVIQGVLTKPWMVALVVPGKQSHNNLVL